MRRPDNEIAVRIRGRHVAIRQFLRLDVTGCVRIAHRRLAASPRCRVGRQLRRHTKKRRDTKDRNEIPLSRTHDDPPVE